MSVIGFRSRRTALRGDEPVTLKLAGELAKCLGLVAGEDKRSFDGFERRSRGQTRAGGRVLGERELLGRGIGRDVLRGVLRLWMNNVLDGCDPADRFLREDPKLEGQSPCEFAFKIDRAAAHPRDDASVLDFWPLKLDEDDGLAGAQEIGHDADHFQVKLFHLLPGENGVGVALQSRANLAEWDYPGRGGGLRLRGEKRGVNRSCDGKCQNR